MTKKEKQEGKIQNHGGNPYKRSGTERDEMPCGKPFLIVLKRTQKGKYTNKSGGASIVILESRLRTAEPHAGLVRVASRYVNVVSVTLIRRQYTTSNSLRLLLTSRTLVGEAPREGAGKEIRSRISGAPAGVWQDLATELRPTLPPPLPKKFNLCFWLLSCALFWHPSAGRP